jgi:hypothetical protein
VPTDNATDKAPTPPARKRLLILASSALGGLVLGTLLVLLVTGTIEVGGSSTPSDEVGPEGGTVSRDGLVVEVPANAFADTAALRITEARADASRLLPGTVALGPAYAVEVDEDLTRPVKLRFALSEHIRRPDQVLVAEREAPGQMWTAQHARFDAEANELVVAVDNFTIFQPLEYVGKAAGRVGGAIKNAGQRVLDASIDFGVTATSTLLRFGGVRSSEPECGPEMPGWALSGDVGIGIANALILACMEQTGSEIKLKVVNNRGIGMEFVPPQAFRVSLHGSDLSDQVIDASREALTKSKWRTVSAASEIDLAGPPQRAEFEVRPTMRAFVFDLAVFGLDQAGGKYGGGVAAAVDYLNCVHDSAARLGEGPPASAQVAMDAALGTWRDCGGVLKKAGAGAAATAGAVFFGGIKIGAGGVDALAALTTGERAQLKVSAVPVPAGTSCGLAHATGANGDTVEAELKVMKGSALCSIVHSLWDRYWAETGPCDQQGAGTCFHNFGIWRCVAPTLALYPEVFSCDQPAGNAEIAGLSTAPAPVAQSCEAFEVRGITVVVSKTDFSCSDTKKIASSVVTCMTIEASIDVCGQYDNGVVCDTGPSSLEESLSFSCSGSGGSVRFDAGL